jgi:hypothetical protein
MRRHRMGLCVAAVVLLAWPALLLAEEIDPCALADGALPMGPLQSGLFDGDVARPRRACPRTEVALGLQGGAFIDAPNFFGTLGGGAVIAGSWRYADTGEAFVAVEAVQLRFVQNATLTRTRIGLGSTSLGATHALSRSERQRLSASGRLTLPTAFGLYENAWPILADVGLSWQSERLGPVRPHGWVGLHGGLALGGGDPDPRLAGQFVVGGVYEPWRWLGVVVELGTQVGHAAAMDHIAVGVGLRAAPWRGLGIELGALVPFVGETRADGAGTLRVSWRL